MKIFMALILGCVLGLAINKEEIHKLISTPVATLPDGGQYYGEMMGGLMHGQGEILWPSGVSFKGQFENGEFHGEGRMEFDSEESYSGEFTRGEMTGFGRYVFNETDHYVGEMLNGRMHGTGTYVEGEDEYIGELQNNLFHGHGVFTYADGTQFRGDFVKGKFTGQGHHKLEGGEYLGAFENWAYQGQGTFSDDAGNQRVGMFEQGVMTGEGEIIGQDGSFYRGNIEAWAYEGEGEYHSAEGDIYKGAFKRGRYHGKGELTYKKPLDGVKTIKGTWKRGALISDESRPDMLSNKSFHELALYNQKELLEKSWQKIEDNDLEKIDLYLLTIAGDGNQGVFRRESEFIQQYFDTELGTKGKSMQLVNSKRTARELAQSTKTSIKLSLDVISDRMDTEQDILFIYLTSHGSKEHKFYLNNSAMPLNDLPASELASMLADIPVKWKVVVVSACYSGGFIPELKDEHTLVITAAAADRTSFGCMDNAEFTYFGEAFVKDSLPTSDSFVEAFDKASKIVEAREIAEEFEPSMPQIDRPKKILNQLKRWRAEAVN
jgi:hypothetical protein